MLGSATRDSSVGRDRVDRGRNPDRSLDPASLIRGREPDATSLSSAHDMDDEDGDLVLQHANDSLSSLSSEASDLAALGWKAAADRTGQPQDGCASDGDGWMPDRAPLITYLPAEMVMYIFSHLTSSRDLRACMLVCRAWASAAVGFLWHRPHANSWSSFQMLLRTLSSQRRFFGYQRHIRRLNLATFGPQIMDGQLRPFLGCTRIERLTLTNCSRLFDISLLFLVRNNPGLIAVDLTGISNLSSGTVRELAESCGRLQGLNLSNCKNVSTESVDAVAQRCPGLKRIKLSHCEQLGAAPIMSLARHAKQLMELDLHGLVELTDEAVLSLLAGCRQLRELRLAHCLRLSDSAFKLLRQDTPLHALRVLDLTECVELTDAGVARIVAAAPRLRNLAVAKCRRLTDESARAISGLGRNLHHLQMGHCVQLSDAGVSVLARHCDRMRYIDLACCLRLTDDAVRALSRLPKLKRIGLVKCDHITDQALFSLAEPKTAGWTGQVPSPLERVHLSYCRNLTVGAVHHMLNRCQELTHLSLTGVQAFLREDLVTYCRPAPREFNEHQRNLFCVFSGKGVRDLRDHLNRIDTINGRVLRLGNHNIQISPGQPGVALVGVPAESRPGGPAPTQENLLGDGAAPYVQLQHLRLQAQAQAGAGNQPAAFNPALFRPVLPAILPPTQQTDGNFTDFQPAAGGIAAAAMAASVEQPTPWLPPFLPTTETWNPDTQSSIVPNFTDNLNRSRYPGAADTAPGWDYRQYLIERYRWSPLGQADARDRRRRMAGDDIPAESQGQLRARHLAYYTQAGPAPSFPPPSQPPSRDGAGQ